MDFGYREYEDEIVEMREKEEGNRKNCGKSNI